MSLRGANLALLALASVSVAAFATPAAAPRPVMPAAPVPAAAPAPASPAAPAATAATPASAAAAASSSTQKGLTARYSFNDGTAKPSVGAVGAKLVNSGATVADGQLTLKNDLAAIEDKISYLEFEGPLWSKDARTVSFAVWFTAKGLSGYERVLDFGRTDGSEGMQLIYFSPRTAEALARVAITGSDITSKTFIDPDALDDGLPHCVVIVIDGVAKKLRVFVDGKEPKPAEDLGDNTLDKVTPVNNRIGRSSFSNDPGLNGTVDEFRVYDFALTADDAAAIFKAGPNTLPALPATAGTAAPAAPAAPAPPAQPVAN